MATASTPQCEDFKVKLMRVAIHEAGHAVVCIYEHRRLRLNGPALRALRLDEEVLSKSSVRCRIPIDEHLLDPYVKALDPGQLKCDLAVTESTIRSLLGGTCAEAHALGLSDALASGGGEGDMTSARKYLGVFDCREIDMHIARLRQEATVIVSEFLDDVVRLAQELCDRRSMTDDDVQNLRPPLKVFEAGVPIK